MGGDYDIQGTIVNYLIAAAVSLIGSSSNIDGVVSPESVRKYIPKPLFTPRAARGEIPWPFTEVLNRFRDLLMTAEERP
jgi:hypothetical protein